MKEVNTNTSSKFSEDIKEGLTAFPKYLFSEYFYDRQGDKLFQDIMAMPEYYLTDCELAILKKHKKAISDYFKGPEGFDLIELGAGDGKKTKILLRYLTEANYRFDYMPVDISQHILNALQNDLKNELPKLNVVPLQGTYFAVLDRLAGYNKRKKVIMVLGSNIGNLLHEKAIEFLRNIQEAMSGEDMLFMGFDQKKNPQAIHDAYNDKTGITEAFNKNILVRINRELEGNFDPNQFLHWESYNPETGTAASFLVSKKTQQVELKKLNLKVDFKAWETIHTEISQKYDDEVVEWLAGEAGLRVEAFFTDDQQYYKNYVFQKK